MKPILFNTDMVRAILEGRKTVTRRLIKDRDIINAWDCESDGTPIAFIDQATGDSLPTTFQCQYQPGDILYVRETWCQYGELDDNGRLIDGTEKYYYRADGENPTPFNDFLVQHPGWDEYRETPVWRPSIHMPKEAARLFLRVTDVRVERLQDMCLIDCLKEGVQLTIAEQGDLVMQGIRARDRFSGVWDSTIKPAEMTLYGWDANPWVWVISFERISREDALEGGDG